MGYLNKATITVDAILTNRGRELLAEQGSSGLNITQFALADDEVDYGLYNDNHPGGTPYYGAIIENMPVLEATPDEQQIMRYKLVSLKQFGNVFVRQDGEIVIPEILNFTDTITLNSGAPNKPITIQTNGLGGSSGVSVESYTLQIADATLFNVYLDSISGTQLTTVSTINANGSITITIPAGRTIVFSRISNKEGKTTATVFGNNTGATSTVEVIVS